MTSQDLKKPDNVAECHALLSQLRQTIQEKQREVRSLEARVKRSRRRRKNRVQDLYRSYCKGLLRTARKQHDGVRVATPSR
jgi:hypothetical protein